ncbi:NYN domain-containing protein [Candidatus Bathyarchaeota archaeon]|nr:NYN domain-containing protein [Candidatus Bathyarchaeota archaeon]
MIDKADVFIDGGYFAKVRQNLGVYKVDFAKFSDLLCGSMERLFTFYYDCPPFQSNPPTEEEKIRKAGFDRFEYSLRSYPRFQVRLGKLSRVDVQCEHCGDITTKYRQKRVDNLLTVDLTRAIWKDNISKAILVTGDSDFVPAVDEANRAQILTHVYYLRSSNTAIHDELYMACSERTEITKELLEKAAMV